MASNCLARRLHRTLRACESTSRNRGSERDDARWPWLERPIWSPVFPNDTPETCAKWCTALSFRSTRRRLRFGCSGTRGWMPIRPIAGCAAWFATVARG